METNMETKFVRVFCIAFIGLTAGCGQSANKTDSQKQVQWTIPLVDIATDATDPQNLDDAEPSIAVNPANPLEIAVVAFSGNWDPEHAAPVWKSRDGGVSWSKVPQIPEPAPQLLGPGDQKIAFDSDGKLYVAELGVFGSGPNAKAEDFVYRQTAGPDDPLKPTKIYGDDQPHVVTAPNTGLCRYSYYSAWLKTASSNTKDQSMDSRPIAGRDDLSETEVGDNKRFHNRTTRVAVTADGKAFIVYKLRERTLDDNFETVHFRVKRSDDCGATWNALGDGEGVSIHGSEPVTTLFTDNFGSLLSPSPSKKVARSRSSDAWIATSPGTADVYISYVSRDSTKFAQIYVARSKDQGMSWYSARVTDGARHSGFPEVALAKNGTVAVMYVDYDDSGSTPIYRHRFAMSADSGKTWRSTTLQTMDPSGIENASSGFLWGDYEGLAANENVFYGIFTGESMNRSVRQLDPIFFRVNAY